MEALIGNAVLFVVVLTFVGLLVTMLMVPEFNTPHKQTILPDDRPEQFPIPPGVTEEDLAKMRSYIKDSIGKDVSFLYVRDGRWTAVTVWGDFEVTSLLKQVNKSGEVIR